MVFSLFKKKDKGTKMPEREIVRPKPAFVPPPQKPVSVELPSESGPGAGEAAPPLPDLEFTPGGAAPAPVATPAPPPAPPAAPKSAAETLSDFEREFTESNVMAIDVDHGADTVQSDVEQVAVLFANGQDSAVRPLLESLRHAYPGAEGIRLWNMLFDLLLILGDRAAFDKLCIEFTEICETSPPTWRDIAARPAPSAEKSVPSCALRGVLTSDNPLEMRPLQDALKNRQPLRVDCSGLLGCDDEVAGRFADLLVAARRAKIPLVLEDVEGFMARLRAKLTVGEVANTRSWVLLLELLQRHATQEEFDLCAIDFAVTFERSPPSWEETPVPALPGGQAAPRKPADDAVRLSGDIRNSRFEELAGVVDLHDPLVLDFSAVRRIDFYSAGQLVNFLTPAKGRGKEIIIRSPNHLVAELMAVVGLNKLARIIVPKS
jgi:anti-anti-sigma regulatory factor